MVQPQPNLAADDTQNDVMTTRPTGDDTQNDVEITADRPVADVHQAADEYQCGDFVLINISVGKRGKILEYVGEVKDVVGEDLVIKYMAESESHPGLFIWPAREDVSRECRKQIVKKMPNPVLREDISSTRLQFFTFAELSPES